MLQFKAEHAAVESERAFEVERADQTITKLMGYAQLAESKVERLNVADTVKVQWQAYLGEGALLRFYVLHCVGIPLIAAFLMAVHFWRVRKDGGISGPV